MRVTGVAGERKQDCLEKKRLNFPKSDGNYKLTDPTCLTDSEQDKRKAPNPDKTIKLLRAKIKKNILKASSPNAGARLPAVSFPPPPRIRASVATGRRSRGSAGRGCACCSLGIYIWP